MVTTSGSTLTGRVLAQDDEKVEMEVDGSRRHLALAEVGKAHVQIEFNPPRAGKES